MATRRRKRRLPPIPSQMFSVLGCLPVARKKIRKNVRGEVDLHARRVEIDPDLAEVIEWQTYWHEATHVILFDSGIHNQLSAESEETLCDAIGNYLAAAMQAGTLAVPKESKWIGNKK